MFDSSLSVDGWGGAVMTVEDSLGQLVFNTTLNNGNQHRVEHHCLPSDFQVFVSQGNWPSSDSWELGTMSGGAPFGDCNGTWKYLRLQNIGGGGWDGGWLSVEDCSGNVLVPPITNFSNGYIREESHCLPSEF